MYKGDRSRKENLVNTASGCRRRWTTGRSSSRNSSAGCRRRSSSRPRRQKYEQASTPAVVEQVVRPTGLVDPVLSPPGGHQVDDLLARDQARADKGSACCHHADQAHGRDLTDYLPKMASGALSAQRHRHRRSGSRSSATCAWASSTCWSASTCCAKGWTFRGVTGGDSRCRQGRLPCVPNAA